MIYHSKWAKNSWKGHSWASTIDGNCHLSVWLSIAVRERIQIRRNSLCSLINISVNGLFFSVSLQWHHNLVTVRTEKQCENYHISAWEGVCAGLLCCSRKICWPCKWSKLISWEITMELESHSKIFKFNLVDGESKYNLAIWHFSALRFTCFWEVAGSLTFGEKKKRHSKAL